MWVGLPPPRDARVCDLKVRSVKFGLIYDFYISRGSLKADYAAPKYANESEYLRYNESSLVFIPIEE